MENEISNIPPAPSLTNEAIIDPPKKPRNFNKLKNFLIGFFIVEHLVILVLLLIPLVFFVRTYATTDFIALNDKASNFKPEEQSEVTSKYFQKYEGYLIDFIKPENERPNIQLSIDEKDINSFISELKLDNVEKIYIEPENDNIVNVWVKPNAIPYAVIVRSKMKYNYENKLFNIDILSWAVGPLTFPPEILNFIEESINGSAWDGMNKLFEENAIHINKLETQNGIINVDLQIDDKVKFTESVLNAPKGN